MSGLWHSPLSLHHQHSPVNPVHVHAVKCQFPCCCPRSVLHTHPGDCHLTGWSEWSTCELTCIDGRSFETMGRQSRSRTFIIQSFENQDHCPQQVLETRPCTGRYQEHFSILSFDCLSLFLCRG